MNVVVDTNVLFTYFWKSSFLRVIIKEDLIRLYTPSYAKKELHKHKLLIMKKAGISNSEFLKLFDELYSKMIEVPLTQYSSKIQEAYKMCKINELDLGDIDFIATTIFLELPLWSNDKNLKNQISFDVLNTVDIVNLLA